MKKRNVPKTLLKIMEVRGLSKTEVAFHTGIDLSRFSRISNGWLSPNRRDRKKISDFFEVPVQELFEK